MTLGPPVATLPAGENVEGDAPRRVAPSAGWSPSAGTSAVRPFGGDDEFLRLLAAARADAVAREHVHQLRFGLGVVGVVLLAAGLVSCAAATLAHLAWALPLEELGRRRNFLPGFAILFLGVLALAAARRMASTANGKGNGISGGARLRAPGERPS
jgi:hypothetical protein